MGQCLSANPKLEKPSRGLFIDLDLPRGTAQVKAHKEKLIAALAAIEKSTKELESRCDERVAKIVGSNLFRKRLGGVDCLQFVTDYDDKLSRAQVAIKSVMTASIKGMFRTTDADHETRIKANAA